MSTPPCPGPSGSARPVTAAHPQALATAPLEDAGEAAAPSSSPAPAPAEPPAWGQALALWFRIGCLSVGGPAAQLALLHQEVVERRAWVSEARFSRALAFCTVLPGPEAQQLATYLGWMLHGWRGALVAGGLFIAPGLLVVLGLAALVWGSGQALDLRFWAQALMPAVLALVGVAALRMARRHWKAGALRGLGRVLWPAVALLGFAVHLVRPSAWPAVVLVLVGAVWLGGRAKAWGSSKHPDKVSPQVPANAVAQCGRTAVPGARTQPRQQGHEASGPLKVLLAGLLAALALWGLSLLALVGLGAAPGLIQMALFFTQAALVTVGGAYAVLPYVHDAAVNRWGWVSAEQFSLGLALGETTPGPLVLVLSFVGFLAGANPGGAELLAGYSAPTRGLLVGLLVTFYTFFPSFVFILLGAPWVERGLQQPAAAPGPVSVEGVLNAAVVGMMLGLLVQLTGPVLTGPSPGAAGVSAWGLARLGQAALTAWALWIWPGRSIGVLAASTLAGLALAQLSA
jgi:chromate transporter